MDKKNEFYMKNNSILEYEALIRKITGIISCKIIINPSSEEITELHILANSQRSAKQIVRDIQSALAAQYHVTVDHKVISIAQIDDGTIGIRDFRLNISNIHIANEGSRIEVKVTLSKDEQLFCGTAMGGNSNNMRPRLVAEAVLQAVHQFLNIQYLFILADVERIVVAGETAYVVAVGHITDYGEEELLLGSSFVKKDENEAVVRASLDAINRRIMRYCNK